MGGSPLRASPTAVLLLDLAGRRATGRLAFGDRIAQLSEGELTDISAAPEDEPATTRHALFVARLASALQVASGRSEPVPVLEPALRTREAGAGLPLAPVVLDAVARCVTESDITWLNTHLNHRIALREGGREQGHGAAILEIARAWAGLDRSLSRPAISTVLAKRPSAGPMLTALLRTGVAKLEEPGRTGPPRAAGTGTLPPPPPRLSILPVQSEPPPAPDLFSQLSARPPLMRLDPGAAHDAGEPLEKTELPEHDVPDRPRVLDDPIEAIEQRIAQLEASGAKGPERARAFVTLADTWLQRLGSVERACRALREACAADATDARVLQQTALYCHVLGEEELALRYAQSAVNASGISVERGAAQRLRASVLRAQGDRDGLIEALCEAAADDPGSPEPHEAVAALLEPTNREGANAHARLAAAGFSDSDPKRAMALLDWAFSMLPADVPTVYEHASLLDAQGLRHAAVAVLSHAAELQSDPDARRKLRLSAAQRAEAAGRPDRAAELLEDALDAEPHFDLLYAPLDEDLAATGFAEHRAVVLEDIATACPEDQRALWLTRAAQVLLGIESQREASLWIAFEAALVDGKRAEPLELLRRHAAQPIELVLLAYALRAAISARLVEKPDALDKPQGGDAGTLLRELAHLTIERMDNPELGLAALEQLARLGAFDTSLEALRARASARAGERERELRDAEAALAASTTPAERTTHSLRVAALLPDLPEAWPRRIELLHAALAAEAPRAQTVETLEALYGLTRDAAGLAAFLEDQIDLAGSVQERLRLLSRLAAVHAVREDPHAVAATCEQILAVDPSHRLAIARLMRAARRLGVPALWARALEHRVRIADTPEQRARLLSRLARAYELAGAYEDAAMRASEALSIDPEASDAALVLLATAQACPPERALPGLLAIPGALCGSARAYAAITRAASAAKRPTELSRALEAWTELLPSDTRAHALRITAWPATPPRDSTSYRDGSGASAAALHGAALVALSAGATQEVQTAVRGAIDQLERAGHEGLAARLCVRLAEEQGRRDPALVQRAASLARRVAPELRTRALELWGAVEHESARVPVWLELAMHHAALGDALGELRALLRVLEIDVAHAAALERLHALLLAGGDLPRALSVATLRLETEDDPERRRSALLQLAALAAHPPIDRERVELYVRRMVAESQGDIALVRRALGVLLAVGTPAWAIERARAIADGCPEAVRAPIYHACAATAEITLGDAKLALELASVGAQHSPNYGPLLLMMERLSLAQNDSATAMRTYDTLIASAIGPHGHRALVYRAGRWLERAGDLEQALRRYLVAFELEPTAGAAFIALGRVAEQTGQLERLLPCYEKLAETVSHDVTRADLLRRAADICLESLHDPARAFSILRKAIAQRDSAELATLAEQAATRLSEVDPPAGRSAWSALATDIEARADQLWEGPDKVRALMRMATIAAHELKEPVVGLARADEAVLLAEREQLGTDLLAEALSQRERIAALLPPELAASLSSDSLQPPREVAAVEPPPVVFEPRAPSPTPPQPQVAMQPKSVAPSVAPPAVAAPIEVASLEVPATPPKPSSIPAPRLSERPRASAPPIADPAPRPSMRPGSSFPPVDRASAREQLFATLTREPWRADALFKLHGFSSADPGSIDHHVVCAILSSFQSSVEAPAPIELHTGVWRREALQTALGEDLPDDARRMLVRLWDAARTLPKYRTALASQGVQDRDRITRLSAGVLSEAYAQAARLLHAGDVPAYAAPSTIDLGAARARVVAAHPPFVIVSRAHAASRSDLSWALGRALTLAMPERVVGGSLPERDARELLEAARLAFAPATASNAPNQRAEMRERLSMTGPKELAAALWQNIPAREQRDLTFALTHHRTLITYEELYARAQATAARAALVCSGQIRLALQSIAAIEDLIVRDEASFTAACRKSPAYAATVRCAASYELREALARTRPSR